MTTIIICTYAAIGIIAAIYAANEMRPIIRTAPRRFKPGAIFGAAMTALTIALLWPIVAIGVAIIYATLRRKGKTAQETR